MIFKSTSESETKNIAERVAMGLDGYKVICLYGDLGAGKTTFTKAFAKKLGVKERVISPTYILIRKHKSDKGDFYHIDAYRLEKNDKNLEIEEILEGKDGIIVIEWADRIKNLLPIKRIDIHLNYISEDEREIRITKKG